MRGHLAPLKMATIRKPIQLSVVVQTYNPSTQEAEAGGSQILGQLHSEFKFKASLGYTVRPSLKQQQ
jgi:hypothetical protein